MFEWHKKEKPVFTGIARGVGGFGFGGSAAAVGISAPSVFSASGGTNTIAGITPGNGYRYHVFLSPGNFVVDGGSKNIDVLIVAGGGGAANPLAAGGGAGGIVRHSSYVVTAGTYPIGVGNSGQGAAQTTPAGGPTGRKGSPSTAFGMVADGGGGGGPYDGVVPNMPEHSGGSGGGGRTYTGEPSYTPAFIGGTGTQPTLNVPFTPSPFFSQYGNPGGTGGSDPKGAGGGGAGSAGSPAAGQAGNGPGGAGQPFPAFAAPLISPEIPVPVQPLWIPAVGPTGLYGGGGGGGGRNETDPNGGIGGPGGGGNGSPSPVNINGCGTPGIKYTGGGGGSGSYTGCGNVPAASGGDGIVIIRYQI
jgi:hypothetical protein